MHTRTPGTQLVTLRPVEPDRGVHHHPVPELPVSFVNVRSTVFWGERTECKDDLAKIRQGGGGQVRNSEAAKEAFMI